MAAWQSCLLLCLLVLSPPQLTDQAGLPSLEAGDLEEVLVLLRELQGLIKLKRSDDDMR